MFLFKRANLILLCFLILKPLTNYACDSLFITKINISGNKITKSKIILRELDFTAGSKIDCQNLTTILEQESNKIFNTGLFILVKIDTTHTGMFTVSLDIEVLERWYIWPVPILEIQSLNINQWLSRFNANLDRLNYGMRLNWNNFLGRKQHLEFNLRTGFLKNYALVYSIPFVEPTQTVGLHFETSYRENNTISYRNTDNFTQFANLEEQALQNYRAEVSVSKRAGFYLQHRLRLLYNLTRIKDTVLTINNRYLSQTEGATEQEYLSLAYSLFYDRRNIQYYPTEGWFFFVRAEQRGIILNDVDIFHLQTNFGQFWKLRPRLFGHYNAILARTSGNYIPFNLRTGLGYNQNNILRGYDINNIEAYGYGLFRSSLKFKFLENMFRLKKLKIIPKHFRTIPFAVYFKTFLNIGYAYHPDPHPSNQNLTNRFLLGGGAGLDFTTYYDFVFRFEYTFSQTNGGGLFFYFKYFF